MNDNPIMSPAVSYYDAYFGKAIGDDTARSTDAALAHHWLCHLRDCPAGRDRTGRAMNYCQTEAYEELLAGMGVKTRREGSVLFKRREWRPWTWDAVGLTVHQALDLQSTMPLRGRLLNIPGKHERLGRIMTSHVVDLPLQLIGQEMRGVRAGLNRSRRQGVTVRMVEDFTDWCFTAKRLWPNHQRNVEWQYYGGQHTHFIAEYQGNVIGTLGFHRWDGVATEIMSRSIHRELNTQELLHSAAMRYAYKVAGCRTFVLGSAGHEGIGKFKAKFRGRAEWITCGTVRRLDL